MPLRARAVMISRGYHVRFEKLEELTGKREEWKKDELLCGMDGQTET